MNGMYEIPGIVRTITTTEQSIIKSESPYSVA